MVQRGRAVPTLSSVDHYSKEQLNTDTKSDERGESDDAARRTVFDHMRSIPVAGRPSDTPRRTSYSGRRSRRNSSDENASQLSIENLGGSQDNLHLLSRNPDKEMKTHTGRRSHVDMVNKNGGGGGFIDNRDLEELEKHQREGSPYGGKQMVQLDEKTANDKVSFADLRKQKARDQFHTSGINITYTQQGDEDPYRRPSSSRPSAQPEQPPKPASANMTSWASQQQQPQQHYPANNDDNGSTSPGNCQNTNTFTSIFLEPPQRCCVAEVLIAYLQQ